MERDTRFNSGEISMSWWDVIKTVGSDTYAAHFQYQLSQDRLLAYQIDFDRILRRERDEDTKEYYTEILGNIDNEIHPHFLLIGPDPQARIARDTRPEDFNDSMLQMQAIMRLTPKQKLDLVRQSPNTYCLIKTEGEQSTSGEYFGPNTTFRYVLGSRRMFDRAVDALENSKEQVREMGGN